jgi:hypothetical protein
MACRGHSGLTADAPEPLSASSQFCVPRVPRELAAGLAEPCAGKVRRRTRDTTLVAVRIETSKRGRQIGRTSRRRAIVRAEAVGCLRVARGNLVGTALDTFEFASLRCCSVLRETIVSHG